jgi:hypothetical protein
VALNKYINNSPDMIKSKPDIIGLFLKAQKKANGNKIIAVKNTNTAST